MGGGKYCADNCQTRRETTDLAQVIESFEIIIETESVSLSK